MYIFFKHKIESLMSELQNSFFTRQIYRTGRDLDIDSWS